MTSRKKIIYVLIAVIILGIFFGSVGLASAQGGAAAGVNTLADTPAGGSARGEWSWPLSYIPDILYYTVWPIAAWIMRLGGGILDWGIKFSVSGSLFSDLAKGEAVTTGWGVARDIVNLFLIFILLYIAISTILQTAGYGAKELLLTLIIIAFLVNFSSVITRLIIDASNVLAMGFYNKLQCYDTKGYVSISLCFKNAFDSEKFVTEMEQNQTKPALVRTLSMVFGSALMVVAGFIFAVFGFLFLIRMVVLIILIILSPLALAAHILPTTQQHAKKWWSTLFDQAFFAPAALFMLYLSAKVANSGFIKTALGVREDKGVIDDVNAAIVQGSSAPIMGFIVNFIIVAILLCVSLVIAKNMGAIGAQTAIASGKKMGKKLQGYAGRVGKRYAAPLAGAIMAGKDEQGKRTRPRWITKVPLFGRGLAQASTMAESEISKYEKQYGSYSDAGLEVVKQRRHLLNMSQRKAVQRVIERRAKKTKRQNILNDPNTPSIEKIKALLEEAEETVESAAKATTTGKKETEKETKKT